MILVTGATGQVGSEVVRALAARGAPVRALVRDPAKAQELPAGVEAAQGDLLDPASLERALDGVDHAFLLTPFVPDQRTPQASLIEAAARRGGIHVVKMGAVGTALDSRFAAGRQFAETDELLEGSGLDWTLLHPHAFMQNLLASAGTVKSEGVIYGCSGDGRLGTVDVRDIAAVAAACLTEPGHTGRTYVLTGPEALSYAEMAAKLGAAIGREVRYVDVPPAEYKASLLGFGLPEPLAEDIRVLYGELFREGEGDVVTTAVQDVTGRPPRSFDEFARDHADAFR